MVIEDRVAPNETEARLYDGALTLFAEKGYAGTSVREIIDAAGVTRPVLYYYCRDKQDLFARVVEASHREAYCGLTAVLELPLTPIERLRAIIRGSFLFCAKDPRIPKLMFQAHFGPESEASAKIVAEWTQLRFGVISQIMAEGLDRGTFRSGTPDALALAFCSLMDHPIDCLTRLPSPEAHLTPTLADNLLEIFLHGVATEGPFSP